MANVHATYWDRGVAEVERMTGLGHAPSASALAGDDIRNVCLALGINLPVTSLLDVGCGTGRLMSLAERWAGLDISSSAVTYCQSRNLPVALIDGPDDLRGIADDAFEWVWACSVFTHIDRDEQRAYLAQFVRLAPHLLVDILPGDSGRSAARWGTDEAVFRADLVSVGYVIQPQTMDVVDGSGLTAPRHRYFVGVRA